MTPVYPDWRLSNNNTNTNLLAQIALWQSLQASNQWSNSIMVGLCDLAIANFLLGKPVQSYAVNGRSMSFVNIDQARALRDYYCNAPNPGDAMFITQGAEL